MRLFHTARSLVSDVMARACRARGSIDMANRISTTKPKNKIQLHHDLSKPRSGY